MGGTEGGTEGEREREREREREITHLTYLTMSSKKTLSKPFALHNMISLIPFRI